MSITIQFVLYCITFWMVVLHYLDSAKEREWTEKVFRGSYVFWLFTAASLMAVPLIGMPFVYEHTTAGHIFAIITSLGGLGASGYHIPMHLLRKSDVCNNRLSYWLMMLLVMSGASLLIVTVIDM